MLPEFIRARDHHAEIQRRYHAHQKEIRRLKEQQRRELTIAEGRGFARGLDAGWKDALVQLRRVIGLERAELLREWREAAIERANRKLSKRSK